MIRFDETTGRGLIRAAVVAVGLVLAGCQTTGQVPEVDQAAQQPVLDEAQATRALDLAERALDDGRHLDARKILQQITLAGHDSPRSRLLSAETHLAEGQPARAADLFRGLTEGEAPDARALRGHGLALLRLNRLQEAESLLVRAVAANAEDWRAWNGLAVIADRKGDWATAENAYGEALGNGGQTAAVYNNRGFSRLMQRRPDDAVADLTQALRLEPGLEIAEANLRLALAWRGDYVRSVAGVEEKNRGAALNNAGFVALMRGDYPAAETYFTQAMAIDAGFNREAHRNLVYLESVRGDAIPVATPVSAEAVR